MKHLTTNQIILLLQINRGTYGQEFKIGTYETDLEILYNNGLIVKGSNLYITPKGDHLIDKLKDITISFKNNQLY